MELRKTSKLAKVNKIRAFLKNLNEKEKKRITIMKVQF